MVYDPSDTDITVYPSARLTSYLLRLESTSFTEIYQLRLKDLCSVINVMRYSARFGFDGILKDIDVPDDVKVSWNMLYFSYTFFFINYSMKF